MQQVPEAPDMAESPTSFIYSPEAGGPACALVHPSTIVREGFLLKRKEEPTGLATRFAFKKRYFRLSGQDLSYSKTPEWQVGLHLTPSSIIVAEVTSSQPLAYVELGTSLARDRDTCRYWAGPHFMPGRSLSAVDKHGWGPDTHTMHHRLT